MAGADGEPDREAGFAEAGRAEQDYVLGFRDERGGGQVSQDVTA